MKKEITREEIMDALAAAMDAEGPLESARLAADEARSQLNRAECEARNRWNELYKALMAFDGNGFKDSDLYRALHHEKFKAYPAD